MVISAVAAGLAGAVGDGLPDGVDDPEGVELAELVVDEAAAASLALTDYYRHAYANKPAWQRL